MKSPPAGVKLVMHAICIMLGHVPEVLLGGRVKDMDTVIQVCVVCVVCVCAVGCVSVVVSVKVHAQMWVQINL
jgi:hypothetical protein